MAEPIPVKVIRYACPHCYYSRARRRATVEHIARCWRNPDVKGCKTCKHFDGYPRFDESCAVGVDLSGRPACERCIFGTLVDHGEVCPHCNGEPEGVNPGPIVGCEKWEAA